MGNGLRHFPNEFLQMDDKPIKRCLASFLIREMQIKITMKYHFIPNKMTLMIITAIIIIIMKKINKYW